MTNDWDIVIAGGGLGGLSLAVELAQPEHAHLRALVLEKRTEYLRDWLDLWMDKILCDGLMADWPRAPEFFLAMFKGVRAETLVAFLTSRPTMMQQLQVSLQLPK